VDKIRKKEREEGGGKELIEKMHAYRVTNFERILVRENEKELKKTRQEI